MMEPLFPCLVGESLPDDKDAGKKKKGRGDGVKTGEKEGEVGEIYSLMMHYSNKTPRTKLYRLSRGTGQTEAAVV